MTVQAPIDHLPVQQFSEPTAMHSWAVVIAQALEHAGVDSQRLFAEAEVGYKLAVNPYMRVPTAKMNRLFSLAVQATGDPCFGLRMAEFIHPTTFHALGYSLFASSTLQDYCERLVRFFRIASDNCRHHIEENEHELTLRIELLVPHLAYESQDGWSATLIKFIRAIYRPSFAPVRMNFMRPAMSEEVEQKFSRYFRCPIHYASGEWSLVFRKEDMLAPLPGGNHELAMMNDRVVMEYLARLEKSDLTNLVRTHIIKLLPSGNCSKEYIAAKLNMSARNLQHKLELQHTTYQDILDQTRRDLAINYMHNDHTSISEITYLLGFSDTSNFARAFKRWTGQSPSQFREREGAPQ
jgi:AraC-like DNA-binding protein